MIKPNTFIYNFMRSINILKLYSWILLKKMMNIRTGLVRKYALILSQKCTH